MSNLLLENTKLQVNWRQNMRLVLVISIAVISVVLFVYIFLLPVTVYTYFVNSESLNNIQINKGAKIGEQRRETKLRLEEREKFINSVQFVYNQSAQIDVIYSIISELSAVKDLSLTRIDVTYTDNAHNIYIVGRVPNRPAVVSTKNVLNSLDEVKLIDFPVSNFAPKEGEYVFTAELKLLRTNIK